MLDGKKVAIMVEEGFEDSEFVESMRSMKNAGARVVVIGSGTRDTYQGIRGTATASVDAAAADVDVDNFDAIIVLGGNAPDRMRLYPSMVELVKKAHDSGKVVAAICHGPQLLISADIVRGRRVTSWRSIAVDLKNAGAEWVDESVVRDGNIITSRKPADLPRFNKAIIAALGGKS
jgi:protease I